MRKITARIVRFLLKVKLLMKQIKRSMNMVWKY